MDASDMIQNEVYFFADHGNGLEIAKFDRLEGDNIISFASIRPSAQLFSGPGTSRTVSQAGNIRAATPLENAHLALCIAAGAYVP